MVDGVVIVAIGRVRVLGITGSKDDARDQLLGQNAERDSTDGQNDGYWSLRIEMVNEYGN